MATRRRGYLCSPRPLIRRDAPNGCRDAVVVVVALLRCREKERGRGRSYVVSAGREIARPFALSFSLPASSLSSRPLLSRIRDRSNTWSRDRPRSCVVSRTFAPGWASLARRKCAATSRLLLDGHCSSSNNGTAAALRHRSAYTTEEQVRVRWHRQSVFQCECVDWVHRAVSRERKINNEMWMKNRMRSVHLFVYEIRCIWLRKNT